MHNIYFLRSGDCGFVLSARFNKFKYVAISPGSYFGVIDIVGSLLNMKDETEIEYALDNWRQYEDKLLR